MKPNICPRCKSSWIRKYGKLYLKGGIVQKFRCLSCRYVWQEPIIRSLPEEISEIVLQMFVAFVRDLDNGKPIDKVGWIPLDDAKTEKLLKIRFCEVDKENRVGRINPKYNNIPSDVASTEEGVIFTTYLRALRVLETIERVKNDNKGFKEAISIGLKRMLKNAQYNLREVNEGGIPEKLRSIILTPQWKKIIMQSLDFLVKDLLTILWQDVGSQESDTSIDIVILVKEALQWDKVISFFSENRDVIKHLGIVWYADWLMEKLLDRTTYEELEKIGEKLVEFIDKTDWEVSWNDIFCLPY